MSYTDFRHCVDDRPGEGVFRVNKSVYSDPAIFELEMAYIFEKTWSYLGHESQIKQRDDWLATHIGRTPVLVMRDSEGNVGAFINACRHKGAKITRHERGNRKLLTCPYHGWAYRTDGSSAVIKDYKDAAYSPAFEQEDHGLLPLPKVAIYKGLVFGSLSPDVPPLEEFLGELRFFIDLAMDQGAEGMELVPGRIEYTYNANWKLQLENGTDAYHLTSVHAAAGNKRSTLLPDLPTVSESGLARFGVDNWYGVLAPAGTPPEVVEKLSTEIAAITRDPAFRDRLLRSGFEMVGSSSGEFAALLDSELDRWAKVIKDANIKVEQ